MESVPLNANFLKENAIFESFYLRFWLSWLSNIYMSSIDKKCNKATDITRVNYGSLVKRIYNNLLNPYYSLNSTL